MKTWVYLSSVTMLLAIFVINFFMPVALKWFGYSAFVSIQAIARQASALCLFYYLYKRLTKLMHAEHVK